MNGSAGKILDFTLGDEAYGVPVLAVQELRANENVTRIADAPPFVKGMLDLRGAIVPIIDMRIAFNLPGTADETATVLIVLNIGRTTFGMVVDSVTDQLREAIEDGGTDLQRGDLAVEITRIDSGPSMAWRSCASE